VDTASEQYRRGATLYVQHCASCHDRQEGGQKSPDGSITYGLEEIGTDRLRATNFAKPLEDEKPFTRELQAVAAKVKNHANMGANPGEHRGLLDLPEEQIRWLTTRGYVARPLEGVWATAPYLHNGSVPTLDDLLKPEDERPVCFPLGHREYDPVKLGYVSECNKVPAAEKSRYFIYDTRLPGNSNQGHNYGTDLDSSDRAALLEYLKVMDPPDMLAAYGSSKASTQKEPDHRGPEVARPEPKGLGMENVPPGEASDILKLKELQLELMKFDALIGNVKPVERGQHPKHHGFVVARFTVDGNIADELRVGLFREPKTYRAVIRFSNTKERDDTMRDNHGMAIKVFAVSPPKGGAKPQNQDFVLLDHPQFFTPNVASLLAFSQKSKSLVLDKHLTGKALLEGLKPSFPNEVGLLEGRKKHIHSPLDAEYFSTTPYKFGATAVKYSAKPEHSQSKDYLREVLVERLRPREQSASAAANRSPAATFGFYVQRQSDPSAMPIEDPTVEWKSDWERVATIEVDAEEFDLPKRWEWGNKLSFSPWHALGEHRPLGGINRARKDVYPASFDLRTHSLVEEADIPMKK
jgi:Cytochrome C oxidase, cbb3-type, subunit III